MEMSFFYKLPCILSYYRCFLRIHHLKFILVVVVINNNAINSIYKSKKMYIRGILKEWQASTC